MSMECAKDEIFQIRYNTKLNRLQMRGENWTTRLFQKVKKHKLITTTIIAVFTFAIANMIMIYSFMKILQNI